MRFRVHARARHGGEAYPFLDTVLDAEMTPLASSRCTGAARAVRTKHIVTASVRVMIIAVVK